jgi:hypothetical protein
MIIFPKGKRAYANKQKQKVARKRRYWALESMMGRD